MLLFFKNNFARRRTHLKEKYYPRLPSADGVVAAAHGRIDSPPLLHPPTIKFLHGFPCACVRSQGGMTQHPAQCVRTRARRSDRFVLPPRTRAPLPTYPPVVAGRRLRRRVPIAIFLPKASSLQSPARSAAAPSPYFSMPRLKPRTRATVLSAKVMYVHRTRPPPSLPVLYRHIVTGPRRHPATDVRCPPRWFVLCARAAAFNPPAVVML